MSTGVLESPKIGLFGKLPTTGDFVARGLPEGLRPILDRWLTTNFIDIFDDPDAWPDNGIRAAFAWKTTVVCLLIVPSQDKSGRKFPLSVCFVLPQPSISVDNIDRWADATVPYVSAASDGHMKADDLFLHLLSVPVTTSEGATLNLPEIWRTA